MECSGMAVTGTPGVALCVSSPLAGYARERSHVCQKAETSRPWHSSLSGGTTTFY